MTTWAFCTMETAQGPVHVVKEVILHPEDMTTTAISQSPLFWPDGTWATPITTEDNK